MEKIKQFIGSDRGKDILTVIIVILVGLASFGLGRLSKNTSNPGIKIEYPNQPVNGQASTETSLGANVISAIASNSNNLDRVASAESGKSFFASSKGKKYYSLGCSAGKSIKVENRIYFATSDAAESAGYSKSASCK